MNGVHDMGGMDGFGKVEPEPNEPTFHTKWEGRVLAMVRAMGAAGAFNIDTSRFYRGVLPPHVYLASSYYRKWLLGLEDNAGRQGFCGTARNLRQDTRWSRKAAQARQIHRRRCRAHHGARQVRTRRAGAREIQARRSRARQEHPSRSRIRACRVTRAAMSAWSSAITACQVFPDSAAMDAGENPQWLYTVVFDGAELWGPDADPTVKISIDAFEPYLEKA